MFSSSFSPLQIPAAFAIAAVKRSNKESKLPGSNRFLVPLAFMIPSGRFVPSIYILEICMARPLTPRYTVTAVIFSVLEARGGRVMRPIKPTARGRKTFAF